MGWRGYGRRFSAQLQRHNADTSNTGPQKGGCYCGMEKGIMGTQGDSPHSPHGSAGRHAVTGMDVKTGTSAGRMGGAVRALWRIQHRAVPAQLQAPGRVGGGAVQGPIGRSRAHGEVANGTPILRGTCDGPQYRTSHTQTQSPKPTSSMSHLGLVTASVCSQQLSISGRRTAERHHRSASVCAVVPARGAAAHWAMRPSSSRPYSSMWPPSFAGCTSCVSHPPPTLLAARHRAIHTYCVIVSSIASVMSKCCSHSINNI